MSGLFQRTWARVWAALILSVVFALLLGTYATAALDVPQLLPYSARMTDAGGFPIADGNYTVTFRLYDAASGGNCLWTAAGTCGSPSGISVSVSNGIFALHLGDTGQNAFGDELFDDNSTLYLGVKIDSDSEMSPRKQIGSAAFALQAGDSDLLDSFDTSQVGGTNAFVPVTDSSGNLVLTGTPGGTAVADGALYLNPASVSSDQTIFGIADNGTDLFRFDGDGELTVNQTLTIGGGAVTRSSAGDGNLDISTTGGTNGDVSLTSFRDILFDDDNTSSAVPLSVADSGLNGSLTQGLVDAINDVYDAATGTAGGLWTDSGTLAYLTTTTRDFAVGGSALASPFSVDVSANTVRIGSGATADAVLALYSSGGDTGSLTYTTDDEFVFSGGAVAAGGGLFIDGSFTESSLEVGAVIEQSFAGTPTAGDKDYGLYHNIVSSVAASTTAYTLGGTYAEIDFTGSGTNTDIYGFHGLAQYNGTGTVNEVYGSYGRATNVQASGTITSAYGVYGEVDKTAGTITDAFGGFFAATGGTDNYAVYASDGRVHIEGDDTPTTPQVATQNGSLFVADDIETAGDLALAGSGVIYLGYGEGTDADRTIYFSDDDGGSGGNTDEFIRFKGNEGSAVDDYFEFSDNTQTTGTGADYAESFPLDPDDTHVYGEGEILVSLGTGEYSDTVGLSSRRHEPGIVGVISTDWAWGVLPRWVDPEHSVAVALAGRVRVPVTDEGGAIAVGDMITSSSTPGRGMRATRSGSVVGVAMEAFDGEEGSVLVLLAPGQWAGPTISATDSALTMTQPVQLQAAGEVSEQAPVASAPALSFQGYYWDAQQDAAVGTQFRIAQQVDRSGDARLVIRGTNDIDIVEIGDGGDVSFTGAVAMRDRLDVFGGDHYAVEYRVQDALAVGSLVEVGDAGVLQETQDVAAPGLLGVVSASAGVTVGRDAEREEQAATIAVSGRAKVRVHTDRPVAYGDPLTSSDTPGVAQVATEEGMIIGYALESWVPPTEVVEGEEEVLLDVHVAPRWSSGPRTDTASVTLAQAGTLAGEDTAFGYGRLLNIRSIHGGTNAWSIDELGVVRTKEAFVVELETLQGRTSEARATLSEQNLIFLSGTGSLQNGRGVVRFDRTPTIFNDVIDPVALYHVFVTPAQSAQLYVSDRTTQGFTVKSDTEGRDSVNFDWFVVGYRNGYAPEGVENTPLAADAVEQLLGSLPAPIHEEEGAQEGAVSEIEGDNDGVEEESLDTVDDAVYEEEVSEEVANVLPEASDVPVEFDLLEEEVAEEVETVEEPLSTLLEEPDNGIETVLDVLLGDDPLPSAEIYDDEE